MKNITIFITLLILLIVAKTKGAEIIPVWDRTVDGDIQDIEFMPNGEQFILTTGKGEIQIRNSEDGELIRSHTDMSNLFMNGYFEFTPDSTRLVMGISGLLQLIDLETFERINYFAFGADTIAKGFSNIVLDPIRPNAYVTIKGWEKTSGKDSLRSKVQIYNYETMQLVKDLTPYGEYEYTAIEVSHDGKYLATLNDNKAYLKVWDLETMELIINEPLFDDNNDDWCEAEDIYFSHLDPNLIYFSGNFTKRINSKDLGDGTFKFFINDKTRELLLPDAIYASGNLIFLNQETYLINSGSGFFGALNLIENKLEYYDNPTNIYKTIVKYNNEKNYFIGASGNKMTKFLFDGITNINQDLEKEIEISPNPTNGIINISLECIVPNSYFQITNIDGLLISKSFIQSGSNVLQLDFTSYPIGVYYLTINCNNTLKTYKIIKEG